MVSPKTVSGASGLVLQRASKKKKKFYPKKSGKKEYHGNKYVYSPDEPGRVCSQWSAFQALLEVVLPEYLLSVSKREADASFLMLPTARKSSSPSSPSSNLSITLAAVAVGGGGKVIRISWLEHTLMVTLFSPLNSRLNVLYKIPTNFQEQGHHHLPTQTTCYLAATESFPVQKADSLHLLEGYISMPWVIEN